MTSYYVAYQVRSREPTTETRYKSITIPIGKFYTAKTIILVLKNRIKREIIDNGWQRAIRGLFFVDILEVYKL